MTSKLRTKNNVVTEPVHAMARCAKLRVPDQLCHILDDLYPKALNAARGMIKDRSLSSSKHWKTIPCVIAKSLIAKYQRNPKCKNIKKLPQGGPEAEEKPEPETEGE